ncbi:hypothetical protein DYB36_000500 [Aphanomyces astaci]|uniref:Uncharacterized protein n=1 Tax=Aphanomyces astaci TaxID=112090 RepID=A0A397AV21_APHAT|nr:hypothetical protein DYB36_000500 [Aphanomyces astaci]
MKVALLGLAAAITVVAQDNSYNQQPSQYPQPSTGYGGYSDDTDEPSRYGSKPTRKPSSYHTKKPTSGYGDDTDEPSGYGSKPTRKPSSYHTKKPTSGYGDDNDAPSGYGSKLTRKPSSYHTKKPTSGYGDDNDAPSGYGSKPARTKKPSAGYADKDISGYAMLGYGTKAPAGYSKETRTPKPRPTADPKKPFNQFYDNLKLCKAEGDLALCIATSQSRHDCLGDRRVKSCTSQFVTGLCSELATTTTGAYDTGYFKATTDSCVDAALADSLLVYNRMLREVNTALSITTQFDQWTFTAVKLALASTRNHADCVIKSFFNFLSQSAKSKVLRKQDTECLDKALNNDSCEWAADATDGWNLPSFLKRYGDLAFNQAIKYMKQRFGTSHESQLGHVISDLLEAVKDQETQFVEFINTNYDFTKRTTSVQVCTNTLPAHSVGLTKEGVVVGADADKILFHLPLNVGDWSPTDNDLGWTAETNTDWKTTKTDKVAPIVKTCDAFYQATKAAYEKSEAAASEWKPYVLASGKYVIGHRVANSNVECVKPSVGTAKCAEYDTSADAATAVAALPATPSVTVFAVGDKVDDAYQSFVVAASIRPIPESDKCVGLSGHFIKFLETGETQQIKFSDPTVTFDGTTHTVPSPYCKTASWTEPRSCSSHLTQWEQHVACCKSYETVLAEIQAAWDAKYSRPTSRYSKQGQRVYSEPKSKPERPIAVPDKYDTEDAVYEKVLTSKADTAVSQNGALYSVALTANQVLETKDITSVDAALEAFDVPYWVRWGQHCAQVYKAATSKTPVIAFASKWCEKVKTWLKDGDKQAKIAQVAAFAADKDNKAWLDHATTDAEFIVDGAPLSVPADTDDVHTHSHYLDSSSAFKNLCKTLKRSWELDTVVPIVSTKCFPQSCVLAQLAKCIDVPEKEETGYDYVTKPQPGYNGYRNSYYQRSMVALETVNTGVLAMAGFVAGAAVVVVAQVMLKARTTGAASSYLLV